ncbi:hypothetical protein DFH07DRAFT_826514 [Mycena maculata]|uniref:Thioredoxin domain-containing protein n=1 Tax=Mycena maculata TaxID=230809 RepID=A0AAD7IV74_9AGAR|nr:hypothetical protein DFH07DRAFT_826514 [Mycena maculata]
MPLRVAELPIDPLSLKGTTYFIFYASIVDGKMWCSDCRAVDDVVQQTFTDANAEALIVDVGKKPEWKAMDNIFRGEPFKITAVPTIIRMRESVEVGRLVENPDEIKLNLSAFVKDSVDV